MPTFQDILDTYAFHAFEKQRRLSALIGDHEWLLDVERATVTFNNCLSFPVQFLGSDSEVSNTWLWADANDDAPFSPISLGHCRQVRAIGRQYSWEEFITDNFAFDDEIGKPTGHMLAMVSTWLAHASCYYRAPHEDGAVYFTISDQRIDAQPDLDREGFQEAFNNLMWQPGDLKRRIVSYLSDKGYIGNDFNGDELACKLYTGEKLGIYFRKNEEGGLEIGFLVSPGGSWRKDLCTEANREVPCLQAGQRRGTRRARSTAD